MVNQEYFKELSDKAKSIPNKMEVGFAHAVTRPIAKRESDINEATTKDRIMLSALGALTGLAATPALSRLIFKNKKLSIPLMLANAASLATTGYFSPDIANTIRKEVKGEITPEEAKRSISVFEDPSKKVFKETKEVSELYSKGFKKQTAFAGKAFELAGRGIKRGGELLFKGIYPRYGIDKGVKTPFSRRMLSYGVRGGLLAGAGYGGYKGIRHLSGPRSGQNYTTFLRNQLLAGNVQPGELSRNDLVAVRKLGMR